MIMEDDDLTCPECGCTDVVVDDDGTATCLGCGFVDDEDVFIS